MPLIGIMLFTALVSTTRLVVLVVDGYRIRVYVAYMYAIHPIEDDSHAYCLVSHTTMHAHNYYDT